MEAGRRSYAAPHSQSSGGLPTTPSTTECAPSSSSWATGGHTCAPVQPVFPTTAFWSRRELYTPVFSVPHVGGTTGAGDSTIAGFLASVFKGLPPEEALTMAVAVGGCCVEELDAVSGIRTWEATRARVAAGWPRPPVSVTEQGWSRLAGGIWRGPEDQLPESKTVAPTS